MTIAFSKIVLVLLAPTYKYEHLSCIVPLPPTHSLFRHAAVLAATEHLTIILHFSLSIASR